MIAIKHLSFAYKTKRLFHDLSLTLDDGQVVGLLGRNGSGKSTLLNIICGQIFAQQGDCQIGPWHSRHRDAAMLAQLFYIPEEVGFPAVRVKQFVKLMGAFYPRFDHTLFWNYARQLEIDERMNLNACSLGQKKRFLFGFALATRTPVLILDEPTNGLDIPGKALFRRLLADAKAAKTTIMISTHQVKDIDLLLDRAVIIDDGKVLLNAGLPELGDKFIPVRMTQEPTLSNELFYSERDGDSYKALLANRSGQPVAVDIELLFNAVISDPHRLGSIQAHLGQSSP